MLIKAYANVQNYFIHSFEKIEYNNEITDINVHFPRCRWKICFPVLVSTVIDALYGYVSTIPPITIGVSTV